MEIAIGDKRFPAGRYIRVLIRATGQVTELIPDVARAMVTAGTADLVSPGIESAAIQPGAERATAPAQSHTKKKKGR